MPLPSIGPAARVAPARRPGSGRVTGQAGDGRKKLLLAALVVFGAASLACAYASSAGMLIAARAALGVSAAFLMPLSLAVLPVLFTPQERPRALGIWVTATAASFPIGPIVGGWLLDTSGGARYSSSTCP